MNRNMVFKTSIILIVVAVFIGMYLIKNKPSGTGTSASKDETFPAMVDYGSHG